MTSRLTSPRPSFVRGVTIVELVVVLLILSILASVAIQIYSAHAERARFSVARATIHELDLAATRYRTDVGEFPISSSGTTFGATAPAPQPGPDGGTLGCGYMTLCLMHSLSGNALEPASTRWLGPYIQAKELGNLNGQQIGEGTPAPEVNILDPWGQPYYYVRSEDYDRFLATRQVGTPFLALGETYFNPLTVQIFSLGPDGQTTVPPEAGLGTDDVNNFFSGN